jgi:hypothetical protein
MVEKRIVGINKKPVAYCTSCSEYFKGGTGLSELKRHKATSKHEKRAHLATLIEEQRKKTLKLVPIPQTTVLSFKQLGCVFFLRKTICH